MNNTKKTLFVLLSGIMLIIGLVMLLDIFNISAVSVIIPAVGIILLFVYFNSKVKAFLYISFFFLCIGFASFLNVNNLISGIYTGFSVVLAFSVALILIYVVSKQSIMLYAGEIIIFFNFAILFSSISLSVIEAVAYTLFTAGVLFVILFAFENTKTGYTPLILAVISYAAGFLNLSYDFGLLNLIVYKCSISALFILSGILILMYALILNKKTEKVEENTDE